MVLKDSTRESSPTFDKVSWNNQDAFIKNANSLLSDVFDTVAILRS